MPSGDGQRAATRQDLSDVHLSAWDFELPAAQIAQRPASPRDAARLLRIDRETGDTKNLHVRDLPSELPERCVLVSNDTRVVPARLRATKETGGKVELLLARPGPGAGLQGQEVLYRTNKKLRPGMQLQVGAGVTATVAEVLGDGRARLDFAGAEDLAEILRSNGAVPLPPYIRSGTEAADGSDRDAYQCVYARNDGAVAAPTAGLHFTERLLADLDQRGHDMRHITLHVGPGTFLPVRVDDIRDHAVLPERYELSEATAAHLNDARAKGRKIIAVGTTTTRVLESCVDDSGRFVAGLGETALTIRPGHRFRGIDGLMTNFHLPQSSLLLLVGALVGRQRLLDAYRGAVQDGYRFYSYGDATLIV